MDVETIEGVVIHVLPECAVCTLTHKSPLDMDKCPEGNDVCHPDMCWRYDESPRVDDDMKFIWWGAYCPRCGHRWWTNEYPAHTIWCPRCGKEV